MSIFQIANSNARLGVLTAVLGTTLGLSACLSDGNGGPVSESPSAGQASLVGPTISIPVVYPTPPTIPATTTSISAFAPAGVGFTTVTTTTTGISDGDAVQISGAAVGAYNQIFNVTNVTPTSFDIAMSYAGPSGGVIAQIIAGGITPGVSANCPATTTAGGGTAIITSTVLASRYSGVAPLGVFFDGTSTTASTTTRPFHELEYRWDFGDAGSGNWVNGSRVGASSRNSATGPVAAHVFALPGTYTITLVVTDGTNTVTNDCVQIAVIDPDVAFPGNKTVCISGAGGGGDWTGCPAGADQVNTSDFTAAVNTNKVGGNKRILFRRGETFTTTASAVLNVPGPGIIGAYPVMPGPAYDKATRPIIQAGGSFPIINLSSSITPTGVNDWRIMDLDLDGGAFPKALGIDGQGTMNQATLVNVRGRNLRNPVRLDSFQLNPATGHTLWDQFAMVDSETLNIPPKLAPPNDVCNAALSLYAAGNRFMLMGNDINNSGGGEFPVRITSAQRAVISNNIMQGQGTCAGGKSAFTLRAAVHGSTGSVEGGQDTSHVVVSDNKFIGAAGSDSTVSHTPQGSFDERVIDVIAERNHYIAGGDATSGTRVGLNLTAREQTIRNNLFDTSGPSGAKEHVAIKISGGQLPAFNIRIYNNSMYSAVADGDFIGVSLIPGTYGISGVTVKNNLAYAPLDTQRWMFDDPGSAVTAGGNTCDTNHCNTRVNTDPLFAVTPPGAPADWQPGGGSYAVTGGVAVPVWSDFNRTARTPASAYIGAVTP